MALQITSMSKLTISLMAVLSLAVAGCGKKGGGAAAEYLSKMEGFSKSMCDCKDKACADKVNDAMTKWGQEMAKNAKPADTSEKPDPEMAKKSADVMTKYTECMTKMMMAGMGGGSGSAEPVKKDDAAGSDAKKDDAAAGSEKKDAAPAGSGSEAKKDDAGAAKKDPPKKDDKKPDDKKAGGW